MMAFVPNIFNGKKEVVTGESNMNEHIGSLLRIPYLSVLICKKGKALVSVNFKNYLLKPNEILILSEDSITVFLRVSEEFNMFYCLMDKAFASEVAYNLPSRLFSFLWESPLCVPKEAELPLLVMWLGLLQHITQGSGGLQYVMLRNHLQNFFLNVAERIPPENSLPHHKYSRKEILCWKFWDMVGKYCKKYRDVAYYAKELCITPFYLAQITKQLFNDSPKDLINRQVILEIKALLNSTDISIKEIAEKLNFEDPSYMNRYFKRQTGMSLSEYRK